MAKRVMGLHWCNRCNKQVQTHDGGGILYRIHMTVQTCDECGYSVEFSHEPAMTEKAEEDAEHD